MKKFVKASRLIVTITVSLATVAVPHAASAQTTPEAPLFGVHVANLSPADAIRVSKIKAQVARIPVTWHLMEPSGPGVTPQWFWDELDAKVFALRDRGVKAIIELSNTPCWASAGPKPCEEGGPNSFVPYPPKPSAYADYGRALARIASRYAASAPGTTIGYEIWNEPNLQVFWPGVGPRPAAINDAYRLFVDLGGARQYADLVKATYPLVKQTDPSAAVIAGAVSAGDVDYINELYRSGIRGSFDVLSMHPYAGVQTYDWTKGLLPNECPYSQGPLWCFEAGTEAVHSAMQRNGDGSSIWFTEFGYSSTVDGSHQIGGEPGQAALLHQQFKKIREWGFVKVALWYALNDIDGATGVEKSFGLYDSFGRAKPAASAFLDEQTSTPPPPPRSSLSAPEQISPINTTVAKRVTFAWKPVANTTTYRLWVNLYGSNGAPDKPGAINVELSASMCSATRCAYTVSRSTAAAVVTPGAAQWWVTAVAADGNSAESSGAAFTIR